MLNPNFFTHNQLYKLVLENGDFYHFKALQYDIPAPSIDDPATSIFGILLLIDERFEFEIRTDHFSLENIKSAEPIHALTMLSECLGFIASDHNRYVLESTGLTPDENGPMAITQKLREACISLAAAYFSEKDVRRFGILEKIVWGNYRITSCDDVQPGGVCLHIDVSALMATQVEPAVEQPITEELLLKYGFNASEDVGIWHLPEPGDDQVSFVTILSHPEKMNSCLLIVDGTDEHPAEKTSITSMEHLLEKLSEHGYLFEDQEDPAPIQS